MQNDGLASKPRNHDLPAQLPCSVACPVDLRHGHSPVAVLAFAVVAYALVAGVLYAVLRHSESPSAEATTVTLRSDDSDCSDTRGKCAASTSALRSERGLVPVASQEAPDDVLDRRAAEGATTQFDEHCRPLPALAAESRSAAAGTALDTIAASPESSIADADSKPDVAPTPAPPDLARAQPQRLVLMVEVEAQHDPGVLP